MHKSIYLALKFTWSIRTSTLHLNDNSQALQAKQSKYNLAYSNTFFCYHQVYRNLTTVTQSDLETVKRNFKWVADHLDYLVPPPSAHVIIFMGSASDEEHCKKIAKHAEALGLKAQLRVSSAHKGTEETLRILAEYEGSGEKVTYRDKFFVYSFLRELCMKFIIRAIFKHFLRSK